MLPGHSGVDAVDWAAVLMHRVTRCVHTQLSGYGRQSRLQEHLLLPSNLCRPLALNVCICTSVYRKMFSSNRSGAV